MRIIGAAIALAGVEKLVRERGYLRMFEHLGWSKSSMRALAIAEIAGGGLMTIGASQRIGGAIVVTASGILLASELRHRDGALAASRAAVVIAGLTAILRRQSPHS